jgi:predicted XRE-type DNA-binding protein
MAASVMDWWKHDSRVAYWVFKPLLNSTRTPDQVVVRSQQVSGEMEDICSGAEKDFVRGLEKAGRAVKNLSKDARDAILGKYNFDILKEERRQLRERQFEKYTLADSLQLSRTTSLLESELAKLTANDAEMRNEIEKELDLKFNIEHWIEKRKLLQKRDPLDQTAYDATTVELQKELDNLTRQPIRRGEEGLELKADEFEIKQELGMELKLEQLIALREWLKTQPNEDRRLRKVSSTLLGMLGWRKPLMT